jgi:hypothetical protein
MAFRQLLTFEFSAGCMHVDHAIRQKESRPVIDSSRGAITNAAPRRLIIIMTIPTQKTSPIPSLQTLLFTLILLTLDFRDSL